ncbi:8-oxoguanine deaminase [Rubrimonas cliftonensis]|uniref:8-oxoguanine deaminase n=1 Tax=Rubrimonas cliftonensis TaxID=89524 RepID=A0A1H3YU85_9RHOB|nr:8-oxoguanine deaminase [Rubrimonas cliftonensis]SEA15125.1 8-oxoguanine deaminase [Rubrimonas cliftonensis]
MRLWLRNPLAILAEGAGGGVVIEGGRIAALVAPGFVPAHDAAFDASAHVVLPGLVNAHHHFYQTLTRCHPDAIDRPLFPWLQALYPLWSRLTPEALRLATRLALTELLMSGVTTSSDHQYVFPAGMDDAMDIQAEEAARLGVRITLNRGSMNLGRSAGGLPPDDVIQSHDAIMADSARTVARWHDAGEGAMTQVALAPCSPFSVTRELMRDSAALAAQTGCGLHTHLAETADEDAFCREAFGLRPLDYLEQCGWMGPRTWLAHGVHFDDGEITRLAAAGVGVCHCPTSNMVLASGACRTREMVAAGVKLGLGVDGSASNDSSNAMEGARHALMLARHVYGADMPCRDVLAWATEGSASCLGRADIGRIAPGLQADLALFRLDELRFSGAHDPLSALLLCGAHRADRAMVAGRWVLEHGAPVGVDVARLRAEHGAMALAFR